MEKNVKVHCLTNPVTMQSVANVLLAAGGSAVMAQDEQEVEEITAICQATLLNTGVPDERKIRSCILAGKCANRLGHPVVLDPVGAGASKFRRKKIGQLLQSVVPSIIRCNQEEASALLRAEDEKEFLVLGTERQKIEGTAEGCQQDGDAVFSGIQSGGVESSLELELEKARRLAVRLAKKYRCTVCMTGEQDVISDGERVKVIEDGNGARQENGGAEQDETEQKKIYFTGAAQALCGDRQKMARRRRDTGDSSGDTGAFRRDVCTAPGETRFG